MKTNMTPMQIVDAAYTACYAYNAECSRKLAGKIVSLFTHNHLRSLPYKALREVPPKRNSPSLLFLQKTLCRKVPQSVFRIFAFLLLYNWLVQCGQRVASMAISLLQ